MKSSAKRIICIGVVAVVAVCAALLAHFFPGNSADGSADIVRASVDENGVASFGCKSDNDYAGLVLNRKDKTFNFMQSYRFSAALSGTYEENDEYLILTAKNSGSQSKFTFKKQKDGLEFLVKKSDSVREFCYSADSEKTDKCLKNKALFTPESIRYRCYNLHRQERARRSKRLCRNRPVARGRQLFHVQERHERLLDRHLRRKGQPPCSQRRQRQG